MLTASAVASEPIDGFVGPFRTVDLATAEIGIVRQVVVREGDVVEPGQIVARLDDDVHAALLAIAESNMQAIGRLQAAQAELRYREQRLKKLRELLGRGTARQEEVDRAQGDVDIAAAQLRGIEEDLVVKRLDYGRARIQWQRRTVRASTHGVVLRLHKEPGEFIGPGDPHLMTIVQLDPLLAVFAVPSRQAGQLHLGQSIQVRLPESQVVVSGIVESISPVIDGKSGTVRAEIRLENTDRKLRSGEPCSLLFGEDADPDVEPDTTDTASVRQSRSLSLPKPKARHHR